MKLAVIAAAAVLLLDGCRVARGPAGFWKTYRRDAIVAQHSDQGPWGGERWIVWRAKAPGTFTFEQAKAFAERNGWKLVSTAPPNLATKQHAPRFLPKPSTIGTFDSGWTREDPGTNDTSPAFGYLQVTADGREMYVHHFWGNG